MAPDLLIRSGKVSASEAPDCTPCVVEQGIHRDSRTVGEKPRILDTSSLVDVLPDDPCKTGSDGNLEAAGDALGQTLG